MRLSLGNRQSLIGLFLPPEIDLPLKPRRVLLLVAAALGGSYAGVFYYRILPRLFAHVEPQMTARFGAQGQWATHWAGNWFVVVCGLTGFFMCVFFARAFTRIRTDEAWLAKLTVTATMVVISIAILQPLAAIPYVLAGWAWMRFGTKAQIKRAWKRVRSSSTSSTEAEDTRPDQEQIHQHTGGSETA